MKEKTKRRTLYVPIKLDESLQKKADSERRSFSSLCVNLLEQSQQEKKDVCKKIGS